MLTYLILNVTGENGHMRGVDAIIRAWTPLEAARRVTEVTDLTTPPYGTSGRCWLAVSADGVKPIVCAYVIQL
jgi:hypothetical protein